MKKPSYVIGIDLGTTNSTLSYTSLIDTDNTIDSAIAQFSIEQMVKSNEWGKSFSLPSFIYFPLEEEKKVQSPHFPKQKESDFIIGAYARDRGAEVPNRLISSAKSWLCHLALDRREKILPLEFDEDARKLSPVDACCEVFRYLKTSWDFEMKDFAFDEQIILVTVPASFDPSARQLIQEAAMNAGYPEIIMLEEPLAAFYAWLHAHYEEWRSQLLVGDSILIVDIGGGTTDFSLVAVEEENGNLLLKRQAVGAHLLLGGDNIDYALAHLVKQKLETQGHEISDHHLQSLIHQCRDAKETLLQETPPENITLTLLGRGSRLIANTIQAQLTKKEVCQIVLDGFFPFVEPHERSKVEKQSGLQQIGLPYAKDPRISCQLAKFLSMTGESENERMDQFVLPTAVLFNGGTLKAAAIRQQVISLLEKWAKKLGKAHPKELKGANYDYAVSLGACYYGLTREGKGIRIKSGTSRSYYIGVEEAIPAVPGMEPPVRAVCVVPFGLEEGEERLLENQEFALVVGEMATFRFFSRSSAELSNGLQPQVGESIRQWKQELTELHPIETVLDKKEGDGKTVWVKLKSKVTELGVLELWCESEDGRKWKLEFDVRNVPESITG